MTRIFAAIGLVLILGLGVAYFFRGDIALFAFRQGLAQAMPRDTVAELPDGLAAMMCGTGSPLPDALRAGPCTAVVAGGKVFIVDAGSGSARTLLRMGLRMERVEALLLTHFHSDHMDGLGEAAMLRWTGSAATAPLRVFGPEGVDRVVDGFNAAYAMDAVYRTAHHGPETVPPEGHGMIAVPFDLPRDLVPGAGSAHEIYRDGDLVISAFRVNHAPIEPAVGYRFDYKGRSLVISGDTAPVPAVVASAKGADLLIHEALSETLVAMMREAAAAAGRPGLAKILGDIPGYHTTPEQAAEQGQKADVRMLALNHIVPAMPFGALEGPFLGRARELFARPLRVTRDGEIYVLPAGSDAIDIRSAL